MHSHDEHLALLQSDITTLRKQLATIAEQPHRDRDRLFLFRELLYSEITYHALVRKYARKRSGDMSIGSHQNADRPWRLPLKEIERASA